MRNIHLQIKNQENGFAMVLTLLVLILITLVSLAALNSSLLEVQIAGNDRISGEAEYSAKTCAQIQAKELVSGNGASLNYTILNPSSAPSLTCNTTQPQIALFLQNIAGYQTGLPGGYTVTQMRYNNTGIKGGALWQTSTSRLHAVAQIVKQN